MAWPGFAASRRAEAEIPGEHYFLRFFRFFDRKLFRLRLTSVSFCLTFVSSSLTSVSPGAVTLPLSGQIVGSPDGEAAGSGAEFEAEPGSLSALVEGWANGMAEGEEAG